MSSNSLKAKNIIESNLYLTISVSNRKGLSWIANLYYAFDNDYNFYWYSPKNSKHSELIKENPRVAIAIFDSTAIGDDVDAVYMEAKAYEIMKKGELLSGMIAYGKKMLRTKFVNSRQAYKRFIKQYKDFKGNSPLRMYRAIPKRIWKLAPSEDYNGKYVDSRIEVVL